jgi:lysozyme
MLVLGDKGIKLIQSFETLALTAYPDQGGIWTIGWGHTPSFQGQTCTLDQADDWFLDDTRAACQAISRHVDVALSQNQFDALVSFTFNVGIGAFAGSTLLKLVNRGIWDQAAAEFAKWDHVDGKPSAGLDKRRAAERDLFLSMD